MLATVFKRLLLSLVLLLAAGLALLLSDLPSRERARTRTTENQARRQVALPEHVGNTLPDGLEEGVLDPLAGEGGRDRITLPHYGPGAGRKPVTQQWRIQEISYSESPMVEEAMRGFRQGLKDAQLAEGTDFTLRTLCAQGDMAGLGAVFDSAQTAGTDLYMVYGTPTLQTAIRKVQDKPVLFTVVAEPFLAGAGTTDTEHLPNVTGVYTLGPYREMAELLRDHFPGIRRVGTLFCPAEANSVANMHNFTREAARCGLTLETVPVNTPAELADAALALCARRLDALVQIIDNLSAAGFPAIARAGSVSRVPVFACQGSAAREGAVLALARDYYDAGRETALKGAQVMRGESPAGIPFSPPAKVKKVVNLQKAAEAGLTLPDAVIRDAERVTAPATQ